MKKQRGRSTLLPVRYHASLTAVQSGDVRVDASIGSSGEAIVLWSAAADLLAVTSRTTQSGGASFPDPRAPRPMTVRVRMHSPTPTSVTTIHDFPLAHPTVQPLPDGQVLAVGARAQWRQDGPERNAIISSAAGTALAAETLGDGIAHVFTTDTGHVWVVYFDEGVFGNYGWGLAEDREPIGSCGLARFSPDLKVDWRFPSHVNTPWGTISDCYALNVDTDTVWTCYYIDFPIIRVREGTLTGWRTDGIAAKALIVDGSRIALYGGYGTERDRLITGRASRHHRYDKYAGHGTKCSRLGIAGLSYLEYGTTVTFGSRTTRESASTRSHSDHKSVLPAYGGTRTMDKLDVYQYISSILPGGLVLAAVLYGFEVVPAKASPSATVLILLTAVAFTVGHLNVAVATFIQPLAWGHWPGKWLSSTAGLFGKRGRYDEVQQQIIEKQFERLFPDVRDFQQRFNVGYTLLRQEQLDGHLQTLNAQIGFYRNMATAVVVSIGVVIAATVAGHDRLDLRTWAPLFSVALLLLTSRFRRFWVRFGDEVVRGVRAWDVRRSQ